MGNAMETTTLRIRRVSANAELPLPRYQSELSAGMDLHADVTETLTLPPLGRALVPTGIALEIPPGFEGQVRPRSGLANSRGLTLLNSPGTIDADYRGEVKVLLVNLSPEPAQVAPLERIAQLVICRVARAALVETQVLTATERGAGGFGSTGTKP